MPNRTTEKNTHTHTQERNKTLQKEHTHTKWIILWCVFILQFFQVALYFYSGFAFNQHSHAYTMGPKNTSQFNVAVNAHAKQSPKVFVHCVYSPFPCHASTCSFSRCVYFCFRITLSHLQCDFFVWLCVFPNAITQSHRIMLVAFYRPMYWWMFKMCVLFVRTWSLCLFYIITL